MNMFDDKEEDIGPDIWRKQVNNNNRVQRASEGIKKGEPADHEKAVQRVIKFWGKYGLSLWRPLTDLEFPYTREFIKRQMMDKDKTKDHFGHTPDITFMTELYNIKTGIYNNVIHLIIEVDGERHDSKTVKKNDGVFKSFIEEKYKGYVTLIRLRKDELLGQTSDVEQYLKKELKGFLK